MGSLRSGQETETLTDLGNGERHLARGMWGPLRESGQQTDVKRTTRDVEFGVNDQLYNELSPVTHKMNTDNGKNANEQVWTCRGIVNPMSRQILQRRHY